MAEGDLASLYQSLTLSEEEGVECCIDDELKKVGMAEVKHCLVGKVLAARRVNREGFKAVITQLWDSIGRVEVEAVGDNIFMFYFQKIEEKEKVWNRGPWHFENSLIVLEKPQGVGDISTLGFRQMEIWVQMHQLPLSCMNKRMAEVLANKIGEVVHTPNEPSECRGKYMRVRVRIDISRPLQRVLKLNFGGNENPVLIILKYERLPEFCHTCGRIGHSSWDCFDEKAREALKMKEKSGYGSWLKASPKEGNRQRWERTMAGEIGRDRRMESLEPRETGGSGTAGKKVSKNNDKNVGESSQLPVDRIEGSKPGSKGRTKVNEALSSFDLRGVVPLVENGASISKGREETKKGPPTSGVKQPTNTSIQAVNFHMGNPAIEDNLEIDSQSTPGSQKKDSDKMKEEAAGDIPCKKQTRKWKRAARKGKFTGRLSSPIKKMIVAQQVRKHRSRGSSLSPQMKTSVVRKIGSGTPPPTSNDMIIDLLPSPITLKRKEGYNLGKEPAEKKNKTDNPGAKRVIFPAAEPAMQARRSS